jgi:hypothetical protein
MLFWAPLRVGPKAAVSVELARGGFTVEVRCDLRYIEAGSQLVERI